MSNLLEITGDDIASLNDADLRALIGQLCEADYRSAKLSTRGITWGGSQDAADGGLDVVVRSDDLPPENGFVPRRITGFQVKKPDMAKAAILKEMKPGGILRRSIKNLIVEGGAYIIVSSTGSTAETLLRDRINAMHEAVADEDNHQNLFLDFLDRNRIATWLRSHPSLILWVRNKIGRQLQGWRPYENWAKTPGGVDEEYLLDDNLRLNDDAENQNNKLTIAEGIQRLRCALSVNGAAVRLAGLSGVGKTRLVQALFDERLGLQPLNRLQVFYTDVSDNPEPQPVMFAEQLMANRTRAILAIDNCPPELHRRLMQACSGPESNLTLLTIESRFLEKMRS